MPGKAENAVHVKDMTANPAPLGLFGFGLTTVLLNLHNAGLFGLDSMILAMGMLYGGIAQIIAGAMEWKKGNTFGMTVFLSFGIFWLTFVALLIMPKMGLADAPQSLSMASYLFMWGILTSVMFISSLRLGRQLQMVLGLVVILFFLLALGDAVGSATLKLIAGYEGIICGFSAIYLGSSQVIKEVYGKA